MKFHAQMICIGTRKWRNFQSKKKASKISIWCSHHAKQYVLLHNVAWVKQILNGYLWKRNSYCLYNAKFVFWRYSESRATRRPTKFHTCSIKHIQRISRLRKKLHGLAELKSWGVFTTCWFKLSGWKIAPGMPLRKGSTLGCSTSRMYLFLLRLSLINRK